MKRTRNSITYRIWKFSRDLEIKFILVFVFDLVTAIAFLGALFLLPHLLH